MRDLVVMVTFGCLIGATAPALLAQTPAARGEQVFAAQKCGICHAVAGKGNKAGALDGVGSKLSADEIRSWIVNPAEMAKKSPSTRKPPMKSFASLPKEDVDGLVAYLLTLKK